MVLDPGICREESQCTGLFQRFFATTLPPDGVDERGEWGTHGISPFPGVLFLSFSKLQNFQVLGGFSWKLNSLPPVRAYFGGIGGSATTVVCIKGANDIITT